MRSSGFRTLVVEVAIAEEVVAEVELGLELALLVRALQLVSKGHKDLNWYGLFVLFD